MKMPTLHYMLNCFGKDCGECKNPCEDEIYLPCSPSCVLLGADRSRDIKKCLEARCDAYEPGEEMIAVTIEVTQQEYIDLLQKLKAMGVTAEEALQAFASSFGGKQEKMLYKVPCRFCGKEKVIEMTYDQYDRLGKFNNGEGQIQDLLPDLPKEIREMFISGMCPECWKKLFCRK